jgi:replicative DNA helicase
LGWWPSPLVPKKALPWSPSKKRQRHASARQRRHPPARPPHNFEAEQALLGAILVNNAAYQRVAEFLRPEHFADPLHGKLYDSLSRLIERGQVVSAITLKTYVEQDETMKTAGGAAYLGQLAAASVHVIDAGRLRPHRA